jgi:type II secretory pathway component PulK
MIARKSMRGRERRGYILLMVIVALVIVATALSSVATRSLRMTQQAGNAASMLQQRWGLKTSKDLLLPRANQIFRLNDRSLRSNSNTSNTRMSMISDSVMLGGQRFDLVLSDENAKLNLNTLYHAGGTQKVESVVGRIGGLELKRALALRPAVPQASRFQQSAVGEEDPPAGKGDLVNSAQAGLPAFRSWGEVFDLGAMRRNSYDGLLKLDFTRSMTLWGSGQVNLNRVEDDVLIAVLEAVMTPASAKSLQSRLRSNPELDFQSIVESSVSKTSDRRAILSLLSLSSFNFSLFVDVDAPQGRSRRLYVSTVDVDGVPITFEFVFH